ncbi:MAG: hypothetical protein IID51_13445 [Proteobacteria bacterium]|nr:hypothetical protein [Pseudomonadota bacterium]
MASHAGIRAARRLLALAVAGWFLAVAAGFAAGTAALAHPPKQDEQASRAQNTMSFPISRTPAMRTRRAPDAGLGPLPPPRPRLGQIPSVAGGISRLDAAGFAPNAPVFQALQPALPVVAPWPHRDRGRGHGRGPGRGQGNAAGNAAVDSPGDPSGDPSGNAPGNAPGDLPGDSPDNPSASCSDRDSGVTVWRGNCQ